MWPRTCRMTCGNGGRRCLISGGGRVGEECCSCFHCRAGRENGRREAGDGEPNVGNRESGIARSCYHAPNTPVAWRQFPSRGRRGGRRNTEGGSARPVA